jgi:hypothetical protein
VGDNNNQSPILIKKDENNIYGHASLGRSGKHILVDPYFG